MLKSDYFRIEIPSSVGIFNGLLRLKSDYFRIEMSKTRLLGYNSSKVKIRLF